MMSAVDVVFSLFVAMFAAVIPREAAAVEHTVEWTIEGVENYT